MIAALVKENNLSTPALTLGFSIYSTIYFAVIIIIIDRFCSGGAQVIPFSLMEADELWSLNGIFILLQLQHLAQRESVAIKRHKIVWPRSFSW